MKWLAYMTTCERKEPTISQSLCSLADAGWPSVEVVVDRHRSGSRNTFLQACEMFLDRSSVNHFMLFVQDDVLFAPGLREHIDQQQFELYANEHRIRTGVMSLWLPVFHSRRPRTGWWQLSNDELPRRAYGALAYAMDYSTVLDIHRFGNYNGQPNKTDFFVGHVCKSLGIPYWYPPRSYCQHIGKTSTIAPGVPFLNEYRSAKNGWEVL